MTRIDDGINLDQLEKDAVKELLFVSTMTSMIKWASTTLHHAAIVIEADKKPASEYVNRTISAMMPHPKDCESLTDDGKLKTLNSCVIRIIAEAHRVIIEGKL